MGLPDVLAWFARGRGITVTCFLRDISLVKVLLFPLHALLFGRTSLYVAHPSGVETRSASVRAECLD